MTELLETELTKLLANFPELKNSTVSFNVDSFLVADNSNNSNLDTESKLQPICEQTLPFPDIIKGHSNKVEIRKSPVHGYGVFAKELIEGGELIEELKLLRLGWRGKHLTDPVLKDRVWGVANCSCNECQRHGKVHFLALGLGSIYNHADNPNTIVTTSLKKEIKIIIAAKPIEKDEEIFISYGKKYFLVRDFLKIVKENKALEKAMESKRLTH